MGGSKGKEKSNDTNFLEQREIKHGLEELTDLQANILKGHDRNEAIFILLKFEGSQSDLKSQIAKFAEFKDDGIPGTVSSASQQLEEFELYRTHGIPSGTLVNFFLTAKGYDYLGFSKKALSKDFDEQFVKGMQQSREKLNDPDPRFWDQQYQESGEIHAMLMVANDYRSNLGELVQIIREKVLIKSVDNKRKKLASIIGVEHASQLRNDQEQPIEHFGYRDGISNPLFLDSDKDNITAYGGKGNWDPRAHLGLVLVHDPLWKQGYGSYLVFRKLEQHVRLFETIIRTFAADTLGLNSESEEDLEQARALLMGRFRDGTPLALRPSPYSSRYANENYNNFNYTEDTLGTKCPFHAHIRKMNPRDDPGETDKKYKGTIEEEKKTEPVRKDRRIVRRGMTYGDRNTQLESQGLSHLPNNGIGLLFMCFQANIEDQFEFLQEQMANNADFPKERTGLDPIAGQFLELKEDKKTGEFSTSTPPPQQWPAPWGEEKKLFLNALQSCVTLKGGEYFFAPSIGFLKNIENC